LYTARMLPEPAQVRVDSSLSETGGRPVNSGIPAPAITGKMVRCNSSTRSWTSRSFQSCRLSCSRMPRPGPRLERGDLRVEVGAADDAGGVLPRCQIRRGDGVGDDVLLRGADELCELAPDRGTTGGIRIGHPVILIGQERRTPAEDQRAGAAQQFGVVLVERLVRAVVLVEVVEDRSNVLLVDS